MDHANEPQAPAPPSERAHSPEPLEALAAELALAHAGAAPRYGRGNELLRRLSANRRQLIANYRATLAAVGAGRWISPAGEWLIDNFHVINDQLREAQKSLPRRFYRQLPQLAGGAYRGMPRAFAIASELVIHTDGRLDIALLDRFLRAYQATTPLTIGELWAIPNALRHAFLDRLARIASRVDTARREREAARALAAYLVRNVAKGSEQVALALQKRVGARLLPSTTMFATELAQLLRDQDPALALATDWLEHRFAEGGTSLEDAIHTEHRSQAMNQTSVGNVIGSMRTITATDWSKVFEALSPVEQTLRRDPSGDYANMEFATRDRYRHVVELVARRTGRAELAVAEAARTLAASSMNADPRTRHVGYYLVDHGVVELGEALGHHSALLDRASGALRRRRVALYLGSVVAGTMLLTAALALIARGLGASVFATAVLAVLAIIPASELAVSLVQLFATALVAPIPLPKLDFQNGLPADKRTLVVVPAILIHQTAIDELLEWLEVRAISNTDASLHFALLTDYREAPTATLPGDAALLCAAEKGIRRLNEMHAEHRFMLLHRKRVWSEDERCFMGWERKRGKLTELNRLLCGADDTNITIVVGDLALLRGTRYVITLDSDTQLPNGTARRLVGAMAHPLNRPRFDPDTGIVIGGHAVLQPRVSASLTSSQRTPFCRLWAHQEGVDPYTCAVSDVYQDLFGEGSYVGKGIYDVRAFERALDARIPERAVLSHDLLEGLFARAGLVSDIELFDDAPSHYLSHSARRHRWIRGDWQIMRWLRAAVPCAAEQPTANPLSVLARWKIADNLRRSLVAPTTLALLLGGWVVAQIPLRWSAVIAALLVLPSIAHWLASTMRVSLDENWRGGVHRVGVAAARNLLRALLDLLLLPHEAYVSVDATVRAVWRMTISHRRLLEWVTAAQAERDGAGDVWRNVRAIGPSMLLPVAAFAGAWALVGNRTLVLLPLVVAWLSSPFVASALGHARRKQPRSLDAAQVALLRRIARKTWRYFELFVSDADHQLPVDNYQENPSPLVAHRTSPTNIGLSLLASVSALDLGYISLTRCIERLERTIGTMEKLERYRGHLLNWYDTVTLAPLAPRYVSTVDSGNLAAMLVTVKQFCLKAASYPRFGARVGDGILDTIALVRQQAAAASQQLDRALDALERHARFGVDESRADTWLGALAAETEELRRSQPPARPNPLGDWLDALLGQIEGHRRDLAAPDDDRSARLHRLAARVDSLVEAMDFRFLFHEERQVFSIGYDVTAERIDGSFYDLLASEARLGSFVAIALGQAPFSHWFKLSRPLARVGRHRALLSWTGTMFEYLLPSLLLNRYPNTILGETCRSVIDAQIAYGRDNHIPWGISESAYNARDLHLNYQYGPFGVPELGIRRGLGDDLVVAPYATALALEITPRRATDNLARLAAEGLEGDLGFYESIDFTPERVPAGQRGAIVYAYMAHHQGMTMLSIAEHLCGQPMRARFNADPRVKATDLLLQERIPYNVAFEERHGTDFERPRPTRKPAREEWLSFDRNAEPEVQLLSNGGYSVMLSSSGGGYSRWRDLVVTRWREDPTRDAWGQYLYLRDVHRDHVWSAAPQPLMRALDDAKHCFTLDKAEMRTTCSQVESHLVVSVATEDDSEIRELKLTNRGSAPREIEVTSYLEVVLATYASDLAHPAFAKLFVETEYLPEHRALLATRRPRASDEARVWAVHVCAVIGDETAAPEHETDRARFLGRGHGARDAEALRRPLTGTVGPVLDPILSLRRRVRLGPGKTARLLFTTSVAETREAAVALAGKYAHADNADRASALAWTHAQSQLHYLEIGLPETRLFRRLAAHILYSNRGMRAKDDVIAHNQRGQAALWAYGISGDLPIVLLRIAGEQHVDLLREALHAHEFWRMRGLSIDLVVLNEHPPTYMQQVNDQLLGVVRTGPGAHLLDKPGGVFVRRADLMPAEDQNLLLAAARVILLGTRGSLEEQLNRARPVPPLLPRRATKTVRPAASPLEAPGALVLDNGIGGFTPDGREYVIRLKPGVSTPAPWVNVLANDVFGSLVSESGSGYEWAENAHENRLTEWSNDPVSDPPSSAIYLRDDETGQLWTPTPLPIRGDASFIVRHGQGYSTFVTNVADIRSELTVLVASSDPVRLSRLVLRNTGRATKRLTITGYVEWTLGVTRDVSARHVVTQIDEDCGALFARNTYPGDLGCRVAFFDTRPGFVAHTGDRTEFLGREGSRARPAAMQRSGLSGRVGAGFDPCAAIQLPLTLQAGEERTIVFVLGQAEDRARARSLIAHYRAPSAFDHELLLVRRRWDELLTPIQIETPDRGLDLVVNRWLLYQVVSARLWGRTGFYQSGGAYGFRDQLQDITSLVYAQPRIARAHILRAAAHQFVEGDVQHWWHPPLGRGVRTRFADDYLWLPFCAARYVEVTGDTTIWEEEAPFIEARQLAPGEQEVYLLPTVSPQSASLWEHCLRALDRSTATGAHGLPLMGCGDWNDGMNRIGAAGRGESVWLAWFLATTLRGFTSLCDARNDRARAERYRTHAEEIVAAAEKNAWDGAWYMRAFYDDGTPLGTHTDEECRIDSIAQSWSVISQAADPSRARRAIESVEERLVDTKNRLYPLLAAPFDHTLRDPGYIKGYVPGVRENGGQYTHAAAWLVLAETLLGRGDRAGAILHDLVPANLDPDGAARYALEPYVVAGDVTTAAQHVGRGGWSWYTGSASWLYRVAVESLLGFTLRGDRLTIAPCIPAAWNGFSIAYRRGGARYDIVVENPEHVERGIVSLTLDGTPVDGAITLIDDGASHAVRARMGVTSPTSAAAPSPHRSAAEPQGADPRRAP